MADGGIGDGVVRGFAQPMTGAQYNQRLMQGETNEQIRASQAGLFGGGPSDAQWNNVVTEAGLAAGRPLPGSAQFYQPVYQPTYQDYSMGNRMGVSQYGQQPFFGGGGGFSGGFGPVMPQMQTPFNFGGQMMGGGYSQFGMNNPFSPYSNSFLNMPSNLNQMGQADKVGFYQNAIGRGFNDQQLYNQASGLFGYQSPQDWSYLQNQAAQMQSPFRSSGPMQPIVSRSAQVRGTPNVMRRAEGGIASLMDNE